MRLNIFAIPTGNLSGLKAKLSSSRMEVIKETDQDGWHGSFYYSTEPFPGDINWIETYRPYFEGIEIPKNINYYAVYLFEKGDTCYALSYGKSHFYLRPYCDYDFGIEVAKRIADETDIKQTASRRFQGKRKKDIKSYASNTRLDVESGESIEYLQAVIIESRRETFGKFGKFGASAQISPDRTPAELGAFLTKLKGLMAVRALFKLPRTTIVTEQSEIDQYDQLLVNELLSPIGTTDFGHNSYDLYGIDFVFSNDGSFKLWCPKYPDLEIEELSVKDLKNYIAENSIAPEDLLGIRVTHQQEGRPKYTSSIKEALDFIVDNENVVLSGGKWMRFNQDYLEFLNDYLRDIAIEMPEKDFADIAITETEFNASPQVAAVGYTTADKDFSIFRTRSSTPIEAWDLSKEDCVYAVKFGTAQKLNYVCDQAMAVLELVRNRAGKKELPNFNKYCLWLGYRAKNRLDNITDSGSIILKQKIEAWARKCRELGIEPVIKISRKLKPGIDTDEQEQSS
jgi:uncharacterized protein (TIGR04141 family)